MKTALLVLLLSTSAAFAQFSSTAYHIAPGPTLPATCSKAFGDVWVDNDAIPSVLYLCTANNVWTAVGGSGGGTIASTTLPLKGDNAGNAVAVTGTCTSSTVVGGDGVCVAISNAFSVLTSATNSQAAMVVGTGASLDASGSGTINATSLGGSVAALYAKLASPTFTGTVVFPSGQALVAPVLGTPTSGTLTNATGLPAAGVVGTALVVAQPLGAWGGNVNAGPTASVTTWSNGVGQSWSSSASALARAQIITSAFTLSKFRMKTSTTQSGTGNMVCGPYVNGATTALTVTVAANDVAAEYTDLTHSVTLAAGDSLALGCLNNASATGATIQGFGATLFQ